MVSNACYAKPLGLKVKSLRVSVQAFKDKGTRITEYQRLRHRCMTTDTVPTAAGCWVDTLRRQKE